MQPWLVSAMKAELSSKLQGQCLSHQLTVIIGDLYCGKVWLYDYHGRVHSHVQSDRKALAILKDIVIGDGNHEAVPAIGVTEWANLKLHEFSVVSCLCVRRDSNFIHLQYK